MFTYGAVHSELAEHCLQGVNIMAFCKEYNAATQDKVGTVIPVEITVFEVSHSSSAALPFDGCIMFVSFFCTCKRQTYMGYAGQTHLWLCLVFVAAPLCVAWAIGTTSAFTKAKQPSNVHGKHCTADMKA